MKNEDEGLEGDLIIFWVTLTSLIHNLQICRKRDRELKAGKHGRGTGGAAPASDSAGRGDAQGTPLPARPAASGRVGPRGSHVVFTDARRREPTRLWRAPTRADSGRLGVRDRAPGPLFMMCCWAKPMWMGGVVLLPLKMEVQLVIFSPLD